MSLDARTESVDDIGLMIYVKISQIEPLLTQAWFHPPMHSISTGREHAGFYTCGDRQTEIPWI